MKFLYSKYVWILLLSLLLLEFAMRLGVYEFTASPLSYSGRTFNLKRALIENGYEQVNVITLGDSRGAQGIDHRALRDAASEAGLSHVSLSMPGSHFLTFKAMSRWSIERLPNLKGIVLTATPANFGRMGNGSYELGIMLPVRSASSIPEMAMHVPFDRSDLRSWSTYYTLAGYREDVQDLLVDPGKRFRMLRRGYTSSRVGSLSFPGSQSQQQLCAVDMSDPKACLAELKRVEGTLDQKEWSAIEELCAFANRRFPTKDFGPRQEQLIAEWGAFLRELSERLEVMVVVLPDHSLYQQYRYAQHSERVMDTVLDELAGEGIIRVADFRDSMKGRSDHPECALYADERHLNELGKDVLTSDLLAELQAFWRDLQ